jgi:Cu/Zn superoxide dismutase
MPIKGGSMDVGSQVSRSTALSITTATLTEGADAAVFAATAATPPTTDAPNALLSPNAAAEGFHAARRPSCKKDTARKSLDQCAADALAPNDR